MGSTLSERMGPLAEGILNSSQPPNGFSLTYGMGPSCRFIFCVVCTRLRVDLLVPYPGKSPFSGRLSVSERHASHDTLDPSGHLRRTAASTAPYFARTPPYVPSSVDSTPCLFFHQQISGSSSYLIAILCVHPSSSMSSVKLVGQRLPPGDPKAIGFRTNIRRKTCCRIVPLKVLALGLVRDRAIPVLISLKGKFLHVEHC